MGGGNYDYDGRQTRSVSQGYHIKSNDEIFAEKADPLMSPKNISFRESRDSDEHPNSLPIIIGLDETASMGAVPRELVQDGLPKLMNAIIENGIPDPQVLFLGVGDHKSDRHPLQVGQFESSDELLDNWLTKVYLENNGGGNGGESYFLPWYFAAKYTEHDHFEKRGKKGLLFTIGDEAVHKDFSVSAQRELFGPDGNYEATDSDAMLAAASEMYDVHHIHVLATYNGKNPAIQNGWRELLGENNFHMVQDATTIPTLVARLVAEHNDNDVTVATVGKKTNVEDTNNPVDTPVKVKKTKITL